MKRALFFFFGGFLLLLLVLSAIDPIQQAFNSETTTHTPLSDSVIVRSDFQAAEVIDANESIEDTLSGKARLLVLLEGEPNLGDIIEENIQLIGTIEDHSAFRHHQTILKLIQEAENVQPISVVCTGLVCNLAIYATTAERAAEFGQKLTQPRPELPIERAEIRPFKDEEHNLIHVVLFMRSPVAD